MDIPWSANRKCVFTEGKVAIQNTLTRSIKSQPSEAMELLKKAIWPVRSEKHCKNTSRSVTGSTFLASTEKLKVQGCG